ncbi:MAG TPA: serine protease, partial [Cellvibrionaceae bacterium]|nr:serine protease [Cellvibrionaceae bacterium]
CAAFSTQGPSSMTPLGMLWPVAWLLLLLPLGACAASAATADGVYSRYAPSLYQIRIMENRSGSRAALGSGFVVNEGKFIATNYHVVSNKVMEPQKYRIEIDLAGKPLVANIVRVDAVHDLALLALDGSPALGTALAIAKQVPQKGEVLYSLGNPHDIGMTVVVGNYNGLVEHSPVEQIHFSGAINSGMSGGPTVNGDGQVIGVNVATAGNQIGFLVPGHYLQDLIEKAQEPLDKPLLEDMAEQIKAHTTALLDELLAQPWHPEPMGKVSIFAKAVPWVECWGNSDEKKEQGTLEVSRGCNSNNQLFLSDKFSSGYVEYEFFYFSAPNWPSASVYRYMARNTANAMPGNQVAKPHAGNYTCSNNWYTTPQGGSKRISYCTRPYKQLPGLFDVFYVGVTSDRSHEVAMDHYTLSGVTQEASLRFLARFKEQMQWQ